MRTKNLGLGFKAPLNSIQSSHFPDEKSLCMLLDSKNLYEEASMKKLRSKLQPLKRLYHFFLPLMYETAKVTWNTNLWPGHTDYELN